MAEATTVTAGCRDEIAFQRALGGRMRSLRRDAGLRQAAVAEQVGIAPPTLGCYEAGRRGMPLWTALRVAEALSVPLTSLLPWADGPELEAVAS